MIMIQVVICIVIPCSGVEYQPFRGPCYLHLQGPLEYWYPATLLHGITAKDTTS